MYWALRSAFRFGCINLIIHESWSVINMQSCWLTDLCFKLSCSHMRKIFFSFFSVDGLWAISLLRGCYSVYVFPDKAAALYYKYIGLTLTLTNYHSQIVRDFINLFILCMRHVLGGIWPPKGLLAKSHMIMIISCTLCFLIWIIMSLVGSLVGEIPLYFKYGCYLILPSIPQKSHVFKICCEHYKYSYFMLIPKNILSVQFSSNGMKM